MGTPERQPDGRGVVRHGDGPGFVLSFGYWCTDFLVVQRAMAAELDVGRPAHAADRRRSRRCSSRPGDPAGHDRASAAAPADAAAASCRPPKTADGSARTTTMVDARRCWCHYFPPGMLGLGLTALMASFMSGMAGNVTAFNTVWTYDIYQSYIKPNAVRRALPLDGPHGHGVRHLASASAAAYVADAVQQHHGPAAAGVRLRERAAVRHVPAGHVLEARHRPRRVLRPAVAARSPRRSTTA